MAIVYGTNGSNFISWYYLSPSFNGTTNGADTVYGLGGNDEIYAHGGDDLIDGGLGADTMHGGAGHDDYVVDNTGDQVVENANEGYDRVFSSISYTLGANVENLELTGTASIFGIGNDLDNELAGNSASNTLFGGGGHDVLWGGAGNDGLLFGVSRSCARRRSPCRRSARCRAPRARPGP